MQFKYTLEKKGQQRMVNPEKLVTFDTQDTGGRQETKTKTKTKHTHIHTQYVLDTNICKHK